MYCKKFLVFLEYHKSLFLLAYYNSLQSVPALGWKSDRCWGLLSTTFIYLYGVCWWCFI